MRIATLQAVPKICGDAVPSLKESRRRETDIAVATMMVLAIIAVILRLVSRKISNARFGLDDLFIVLGVVNDQRCAPRWHSLCNRIVN